jgi:transposase
MITPLTGVQVWVATTPVDMRKSFDSLAEVVKNFLGQDPLSGHLFVFRNKGGQLVKILWWDEGGLAIYYKRLERGEFQFPRTGQACDRDHLRRVVAIALGSRRESDAGGVNFLPFGIAPSRGVHYNALHERCD